MPDNVSRFVFGREGRLGRIEQFPEMDKDNQTSMKVKFDTGEEAWIPFDQLELLPDGSYYLHAGAGIDPWKPVSNEISNDQTEEDLVIPVIEEEIEIGKQIHKEKVQVSKRVHEEEVEVDEPGYIEEIEIERIPKNEVLDAPVSSYEEGEILVIPIVEERVVVTKHLVLVEEVRVKKVRKEVRDPQRVKVRREEVVIDRNDD